MFIEQLNKLYMPRILDIKRNYTINRTFDESIERIDAIISTPFNSSKFRTSANLVSTKQEYIIVPKWVSAGRPFFFKAISPVIFARLFKNGDKTKILIGTKTSPLVLIFLFLVLAVFIIKILIYQNFEDLKISAVYLLLAILALGLDRLMKNNLVASFEKDMALKL
jgi:hypothetical protein